MTILDKSIALLRGINQGFAWIGKHLSLSLMAVMTVIILLQVFYRYVLNAPLSWTEEAARFMMVWMTFLIAPIAYRQGWNVAIDMFSAMLKGRARYVLQLVIDLLVMLIIIMFLKILLEKQGIVARGWGRSASSFEMTMFWVYLAMPVGVGAMVLVGLELILDGVRHILDPGRGDDAHTPQDPSLTPE